MHIKGLLCRLRTVCYHSLMSNFEHGWYGLNGYTCLAAMFDWEEESVSSDRSVAGWTTESFFEHGWYELHECSCLAAMFDWEESVSSVRSVVGWTSEYFFEHGWFGVLSSRQPITSRFIIPRLRPGLLSLRSVLSSRQVIRIRWILDRINFLVFFRTRILRIERMCLPCGYVRLRRRIRVIR